MGNGEKINCELTGDLYIKYKNQDGRSNVITLKNVHYVPLFWCNLFYITSSMEKGIDLLGSGKSLLLKDKICKRDNIEFYKILISKTGFLCYLEVTHVKNFKHTNGSNILTTSKDGNPAISYTPASLVILESLWDELSSKSAYLRNRSREDNIDINNILGKAKAFAANKGASIGAVVSPNQNLSLLST